MKTNHLACAVLALICASAHAGTGQPASSNYYVVVPVMGKTYAESQITMTLTPYTLPGGIATVAYPGFDFVTLLSVLGDPVFNGAHVKWTVSAGALPAGLTLGANGQLSGTPSGVGASAFTVKATYKSKAGEASYSVAVQVNIDFSLSQTALAFGAVTKGSSASQTLTVTNTGGAPLTLAPLTPPAGYAASHTCNGTAPASSCAIQVTFLPTLNQTYTGTLAVASLANEAVKAVSLTGTGSDPVYAKLDPATANGSCSNVSDYTATGTCTVAANKPKSSGKWYFEMQDFGGAVTCMTGLKPASETGMYDTVLSGAVGSSYGINFQTIMKSTWAEMASFNHSGQKLGVAYDLDNMTVSFVTPSSTFGPYPLNKPVGTSFVPVASPASCNVSMNFGQSPFTRTVPAGYNRGVF